LAGCAVAFGPWKLRADTPRWYASSAVTRDDDRICPARDSSPFPPAGQLLFFSLDDVMLILLIAVLILLFGGGGGYYNGAFC
jgi:hypothetical protein